VEDGVPANTRPRFHSLVRPIFLEADRGRRLVTSALTLLEVLALPLRHGDRALAGRYERALSSSANPLPGLQILQLSDYV
jgi:hypothetical protein